MTLSSFWVRPRSRRRETSSKAKSPPKKLPANTPEISSCHRYLEKHGACVGSISSTAYRRFCGIAQVLQHPFATRDLVQSMGKAKHAKYSMDQILHSNRFNDLDIVLADWFLSKLVNLDFTMRSYLVNANTRISYWRPPPTNYRQRTIIVTWVHSTPVLPPPVYVTVRHVQNTFANGFSMTKKSERIPPSSVSPCPRWPSIWSMQDWRRMLILGMAYNMGWAFEVVGMEGGIQGGETPKRPCKGTRSIRSQSNGPGSTYLSKMVREPFITMSDGSGGSKFEPHGARSTEITNTEYLKLFTKIVGSRGKKRGADEAPLSESYGIPVGRGFVSWVGIQWAL